MKAISPRRKERGLEFMYPEADHTTSTIRPISNGFAVIPMSYLPHGRTWRCYHAPLSHLVLDSQGGISVSRARKPKAQTLTLSLAEDAQSGHIYAELHQMAIPDGEFLARAVVTAGQMAGAPTTFVFSPEMEDTLADWIAWAEINRSAVEIVPDNTKHTERTRSALEDFLGALMFENPFIAKFETLVLALPRLISVWNLDRSRLSVSGSARYADRFWLASRMLKDEFGGKKPTNESEGPSVANVKLVKGEGARFFFKQGRFVQAASYSGWHLACTVGNESVQTPIYASASLDGRRAWESFDPSALLFRTEMLPKSLISLARSSDTCAVVRVLSLALGLQGKGTPSPTLLDWARLWLGAWLSSDLHPAPVTSNQTVLRLIDPLSQQGLTFKNERWRAFSRHGYYKVEAHWNFAPDNSFRFADLAIEQNGIVTAKAVASEPRHVFTNFVTSIVFGDTPLGAINQASVRQVAELRNAPAHTRRTLLERP